MKGTKHQTSSSTSSRESSTAPPRGDDPFDDENTIESFGVADGFQSSFNLQNMPSSTRVEESEASTTRGRSSVFRRESQKKHPLTQENTSSLMPRNSFSLRHDAQYSDHPRRLPSVSSTSDQIPPMADARPTSLLSRHSTYVRPESTYNGPSAPSHPYGMYHQNSTETPNRASQVSTIRPTRERSYHGRDRPTHPYAMYPQNPVSASDSDTLNASTDIASVGFPGLSQQYARRLGPDGEEADDIIGPDGHTEQLPPYSRFAHDGFAPFKRDSHAAYGQLPTIPAEPSFTANDANSMSDTLLSPTTNNSTARIANTEPSNSVSKEKWSKKSKRRTCFGRLPVWAVALIITILIAASALMGGLIGRKLASNRSKGLTTPGSTDQPQTASSTVAVDPSMPTFGSAPLPAPLPVAPPLPTGTFDLTLNTPSEQCGTCLPDTQQAAWDCMTDAVAMGFTVKNPILAAGNVQLVGPDSNTVHLMYGGQYPSLESNITASFNLDPNNKSAGTALYFNSTYTKQVLLPFHGDDTLSLFTKRSLERHELVPRGQTARTQIRSGAPVWNCIWPETNIDGFIYVNDDIPVTPTSPTSSSSSVAASSTAVNNQDGILPVSSGPYPKKVKLIEYRTRGSAKAVCTLMKHENGALVQSDAAPNGVNTTITLDETDPPLQNKFIIAKWRKGESIRAKRDDYQGYCSCELSNAP